MSRIEIQMVIADLFAFFSSFEVIERNCRVSRAALKKAMNVGTLTEYEEESLRMVHALWGCAGLHNLLKECE
jgi:hypothetical protein